LKQYKLPSKEEARYVEESTGDDPEPQKQMLLLLGQEVKDYASYVLYDKEMVQMREVQGFFGLDVLD